MKSKSIRTQKVSKAQQLVEEVPSSKVVWDTIDFNHSHREMIMAIKAKPFLILAGISGTGKSRFPRMLSYKCCTDRLKNVNGDPGNFLLIQIQPDWHDATYLLGYNTLRGPYLITSFIFFLAKAWKNVDIPFILCLDEMNIAPVEQYFATFLSIIESKRFIGNRLISDTFISPEDMHLFSKKDKTFWSRLGIEMYPHLQQQFLSNGITMPPNLIVIGTMNMDETTHSISKKVLDRAMTFDMSKISMYLGLTYKSDDFEYPDRYLPAHALLGFMNDGYEAYELNKENGDKILKVLLDFDFVLADTKFRFGYRTRNEILIYCYFNSQLAGKPDNWLEQCIDEMIQLKILPKITGKFDESKLLDELLKITNRFPKSHQKLLEIKAACSESSFGYGSFFQQ